MARRKGLKDLYIAEVTKNEGGEYQTGTPERLARAITAKVSVKRSSEKLYSDDGVEDIANSFDGVDVELNVNDLTPEMYSKILGALYENGFLVEGQDDNAKEIALGYRSKRTNNKYEFVWLYCGKASEGMEDEYETEGDKLNTKTPTIKFSFYAREKDGYFRNRVFEDALLESNTDAKTAIINWFKAVQEPGGNTPPEEPGV